VREWAARGWTVGMHGYQHDYVTSDSGIVKVNPFSEFAGLPADHQRAKLRAAKEIFDRERVTPRIWIAPAHSFDAVTISLLREVGISIISDGFGLYPSVDRYGMLWIPQQIARFHPLPFGVFTVCIHHNGWTQADLASFRLQLAKYRDCISSVEEIERVYAGRLASWLDELASAFLSQLSRWKNSL
jgi:peptidoglycan/xylan/chitin deacetylase (PgdA/CDA1 family)